MNRLRICTLATAFAALLLVGVFWVPLSFSQSTAITADVPFAFYAFNRVMPPGTYTLQASSMGSLVIRISDDHGNATFVGTTQTTNRRPSMARLVFNRYGSTYFLSELDWPSNAVGHALLKTEYERELIAANPGVPVELTAK